MIYSSIHVFTSWNQVVSVVLFFVCLFFFSQEFSLLFKYLLSVVRDVEQ